MSRKSKIVFIGSATVLVILACLTLIYMGGAVSKPKDGKSIEANFSGESPISRNNPLDNKVFYVDQTRSVVKAAADSRSRDNLQEAGLLDKIASQPGVIWLVGPSKEDPTAKRDINLVVRTSTEAGTQKSLPVYQLYAIPNRDACAGYSKGGFSNEEEYINWLNNILSSLKTEAVFLIEADSIGHAIKGDCLTEQQAEERYRLLNRVVSILGSSSKVLASYMDATHSDWFPDPVELVDPLIKSGVRNADGVSVNVSNFIETDVTSSWSERLIGALGGDLGVVIDTSRNGKGPQDPNITGDARWCNPTGRGLGNKPTTDVNSRHIDAYLWVKTPGESDGACFGHPEAGTFVTSIALELARNSN